MTLFDVIAILILLVSAVIGLVRGALREVLTVFAFVLAVLAAIFALRFTGPIARQAIDPDWAGNAAAVLIVFVAAYLLIRVLGSGLTNKIHQTEALGTLDRVIGLGFGLVRGLVVLGVFHLVFHAATPPDRVPHWISDAALYPLSETCAKALRKLAPEGSAVAGQLGPHLEKAVREGAKAGPSDKGPGALSTEQNNR
jgi:membrane protein required for colicin V production